MRGAKAMQQWLPNFGDSMPFGFHERQWTGIKGQLNRNLW